MNKNRENKSEENRGSVCYSDQQQQPACSPSLLPIAPLLRTRARSCFRGTVQAGAGDSSRLSPCRPCPHSRFGQPSTPSVSLARPLFLSLCRLGQGSIEPHCRRLCLASPLFPRSSPAPVLAVPLPWPASAMAAPTVLPAARFSPPLSPTKLVAISFVIPPLQAAGAWRYFPGRASCRGGTVGEAAIAA